MPGMQVFYAYVDNIREKYERILLLCFLLELWRVENATSAW